MRNIGFIGTQKEMTKVQRAEVIKQIHQFYSSLDVCLFHYGDPIGDNAEAAEIAKEINYCIIGHPSDNEAFHASFPNHFTAHPFENEVRNRNIINSCKVLIITSENMNSTIWSFINYVYNHKVIVIFPDGRILSIISTQGHEFPLNELMEGKP